jgi:hypothetical protein
MSVHLMNNVKIYKEIDYPVEGESSLSYSSEISSGDKFVCPFNYPTITHPNTIFVMNKPGFSSYFQLSRNDKNWCL